MTSDEDVLLGVGWRHAVRIGDGDEIPKWGEYIYFLFDEDGELSYIGTTSDLPRRLGNHRGGKGTSNHQFAYALVLDYTYLMGLGDRFQLEESLIQQFKPPQNRAYRRGVVESSEDADAPSKICQKHGHRFDPPPAHLRNQPVSCANLCGTRRMPAGQLVYPEKRPPTRVTGSRSRR